MKQFSTFTLCLLLLVGCQKNELQPSSGTRSDYLQQIKLALQDSVSAADFGTLDFSRAALSSIDSVDLHFLRVPFKNESYHQFLLLKTSKEGIIERGRFIQLDDVEIQDENGRKKFEAMISIQNLQRKLLLHSSIENGYITAFHQDRLTKLSVVQPPGMLPEVVITYTIPSTDGVSWSTWLSLQSLSGLSPSAFYNFFEGGGDDGNIFNWGGGGSSGNSGNNGGSGSGSAPFVDPPLQVDFEWQGESAAIDLQKFINCFNAIPDQGATCSIDIFADIPVDGDPYKLFDFNSGSPGHTFINIRKTNGTQSASQNIGFYPKAGWKTVLTNAPIDGKFVDNGRHEFNAGFKMNLTPAELSTILIKLVQLKAQQYDIDNYNCTDWALEVFNEVRTDKLQIPMYHIPGNVPSTGTSTPQGIYNRLKEMKNAGHPEAANIRMDIVKGWAGNSTGSCN